MDIINSSLTYLVIGTILVAFYIHHEGLKRPTPPVSQTEAPDKGDQDLNRQINKYKNYFSNRQMFIKKFFLVTLILDLVKDSKEEVELESSIALWTLRTRIKIFYER